MKRFEKLTKRYQKYTTVANAKILARCVIEHRGGYGLFRAFGVPTQKDMSYHEEKPET